MKLSGLGRPSRRLSHFALRRVCCCGPRRQAISIDCCTARLLQARPPFDPHPQQHGSQQQLRAVSRLPGGMEAEHRVVKSQS